MFSLSQQQKNDLWWLIISVDYHYSRIAIAEFELTSSSLILWLEDKQDYKNSLDECLELHVPLRSFARVIRNEGLNVYERMQMHTESHFLYPALVEINTPLKWYNQDATATEQRWAREAVLKTLLTQLVESETALVIYYAI